MLASTSHVPLCVGFLGGKFCHCWLTTKVGHGVVFEPSVNAGALFLLPDTFASGCASVLAIGRDVSESLRLTVGALESLEMESRHSLASSSDGSSSEMMAPNTFAPLLATVRYLSTRVSGDTSED